MDPIRLPTAVNAASGPLAVSAQSWWLCTLTHTRVAQATYSALSRTHLACMSPQGSDVAGQEQHQVAASDQPEGALR